MGLVTGLSALVTGGSAGIGRATALKFSAEGANVIVSDIEEKGGQETVDMIEKASGTATLSGPTFQTLLT